MNQSDKERINQSDELHTLWYENGQKKRGETCITGDLISVKEWNKDGSVKE